jgi:hypothetical protein
MQATVNLTGKLYRLYGYCNVKRILILAKEEFLFGQFVMKKECEPKMWCMRYLNARRFK